MKNKSIYVALVVVIAFAAVLGGTYAFTVSGNNNSKTSQTDIPGKWSIGYSPDMSEGFNSRPLMVWSTQCDKKTLSVRGIFVQSLTNKKVSALKVGWRFVKKIEGKDEFKTLKSGETKIIRLEKDLNYKDTKYLEGGFISLYDVYEPFLKKGKLEGDYKFQVLVSEVFFSDNSSWKLGDKKNVEILSENAEPSFVNASLGTTYVIPAEINPKQVCPNQACQYVPGHLIIIFVHQEIISYVQTVDHLVVAQSVDRLRVHVMVVIK